MFGWDPILRMRDIAIATVSRLTQTPLTAADVASHVYGHLLLDIPPRTT